MKKFIGILVMLCTTTIVFGQSPNGNSPNCGFNYMPVIEGLERQYWDSFFEIDIYHFYENGKLFVLSYDTSQQWKTYFFPKNGIKERKIYLYRKDADGWHVASNLVKTDIWNYKTGDWEFITSNFRARIVQKSDFNELLGNDVGYSEVSKSSDGSVIMKVMYFYGNQKNDDEWKYYWTYFSFIPVGDGMYEAKISH